MRNYIRLLHIKLNTHLVSIMCFGIAILLFMTPSLKAAQFSDTIESWARNDIDHLSMTGLCNGYQDGLFRPNDSISRAEFTKILINTMGYGEEAAKLEEGISTYTDVDFSYWGKSYIQIASEIGLAFGAGNIFAPEQNISREQAALMLSRVLEYDSEVLYDELPFIDKDEISDQAQDGLRKAYHEGFIKGYVDGSFRPAENLSRAEAVVMVARLMERQGLLYQFQGSVKQAKSGSATININGNNREFTVAPNAIIVDINRRIDTLDGVINARISFNINDNGEINFAQLEYQDKYLNSNVYQLEDISANPIIGQTDSQTSNESSVAQNRWAEKNELSIDQPGLSLEITKKLTQVEELNLEYGLSGEGVVIAVIDSGIDALHQDLKNSAGNSAKILDWVNFTSEGKVNIPYTADYKGANILSTQHGNIRLPHVDSVSGQYRYGIWQEEWIFTTQEMDFTGNHESNDKILVLLVDSKQAGVYDTVFVDTNSNLSLQDEVPLHIYRDYKYSYASFPRSNTFADGFPFVLTDIGANGSEVSFGYDSIGHGTHVAGIAAAKGEIQGVAPNAKLIAIKVVDSSGITTIDNMVKGIRYALQQGANIINISLGQYLQDSNDLEYFNEMINRLAGEKVVFVAASGNAGPGIASLATPGDVENVISVGAFIAPEMWKSDYGLETQADGLWYFSSNGPNTSGTWKPDLIAPGSVVSTFPVWKENNYFLDEGTSMAAPFVSGMAALLMEGMWMDGKPVNSFMIKRALAEGAKLLEGPELIEQGHGLVDAVNSWAYLQESSGLARSDLLDIRVGLFDDEKEGIYSRGLIPGISVLEAINRGKESVFVNWQSNYDWLKPQQNQTQIAPGSSRTISVLYSLPQQTGLYNGLLEGLVENLPHNKVEFLNTLVIPIELDNKKEFLEYSSLEAGQIKRYYFKVSENADTLNLKLKILGTINNMQGRARVHIYDPKGDEYAVSNYAGVGSEGLESTREVEVMVDKPGAGTWEVVVYSSATLGLYNLEKSEYVLTVELEQAQVEKYKYIDKNFIIGCAYPRDSQVPELISLTILDEDKHPYNGRLLINNRLYEVRDGMVKIFPKFKENTLELIIQRVT